MNTRNDTKRSRLGALFLVGQFITILGVVVALFGFFINFIVVILGLILCTSGISITKFSKGRFFESDGSMFYEHLGHKHGDKITSSASYVGYVAIILALFFLLFMFINKSTAYKSVWPVYGFVASVILYLLTIFLGSCYFAWKVFFKKNDKG